MEFFVGCSGWQYKDWKERFYPEGVPQKEFLNYYAEHFPSVEVNATFYRLPAEKTFRKWREETPEDFLFTLKGSRYITHLKKLKEVTSYVEEFYERLEPLKEKLGCILWQLPGNFKKNERNEEKLEAFCKVLPSEVPRVIEFRDPSWFEEGTRERLARWGIVPCSVSSSFEVPETVEMTNGTVYLRFHGKGKERYKYFYEEDELRQWADALKAKGVRTVYAYFNNDYDAHAPMNAKSFISMLSEGSE